MGRSRPNVRHCYCGCAGDSNSRRLLTRGAGAAGAGVSSRHGQPGKRPAVSVGLVGGRACAGAPGVPAWGLPVPAGRVLPPAPLAPFRGLWLHPIVAHPVCGHSSRGPTPPCARASAPTRPVAVWGDLGSGEALRAPLVAREEPALGLRRRGTNPAQPEPNAACRFPEKLSRPLSLAVNPHLRCYFIARVQGRERERSRAGGGGEGCVCVRERRLCERHLHWPPPGAPRTGSNLQPGPLPLTGNCDPSLRPDRSHCAHRPGLKATSCCAAWGELKIALTDHPTVSFEKPLNDLYFKKEKKKKGYTYCY